ncbi:MAG: anthranilate synthase component I [Gammaproteobacteria bacterium]|nr:anthranilate synthase component I [Gammaproteobacteria bacterium]
MTAEQFQSYASQGYNHIPVAREILADLDTPLSAYIKLASGARTFLLESVVGGEKWGRYSMIGLAANTVLKVSGSKFTVEMGSKVVASNEVTDPFAEIGNFQRQFRVPQVPGLPRFTGGLVGYFGYDCVRYIEPRLARTQKPDPLACPDIMLMVADRVLVFDNLGGKAIIIVHADPSDADAYGKACHDLDLLAAKLTQSTIADERAKTARPIGAEPKSGFPQDEHARAVNKIKEYIVEGDVMQVVLSHRLSIPFVTPPLHLYRALRTLNPSPYMYFLNFSDFQVVGASPEVLVRLEDGEVTVRPIAGTRPRGKSEHEDQKLERELLADPKELAEHLMLIDLGRNDVGRIAQVGTVKVTEQMVVERYSHVMHIVSNVQARLREGASALDVLRATFPAGTVSGAPKVRAMEIIDELEPVKRGIYAGAIGYLSWAGNMDTAIAIRTAVVKDYLVHVQAGGGIVADSVPQTEWEETMNKAKALLRAVAVSESGLT